MTKLIFRRISQLLELKTIERLLSAGRDPRAMDTRGPVTAQRVPMAAGMPGAVPHGMGPNAPPNARPVRQPRVCQLLPVLVVS